MNRRGKKIAYSYILLIQPLGQPIGVNVHCIQHPIREQSLSSQPSQKTQKLSTQMKNHSHASRIPSPDQSPSCHSAEWKLFSFCHAQHHRLSRYGIEDCFTVQTPKRKRLFLLISRTYSNFPHFASFHFVVAMDDSVIRP
ncbi:hypothetical protein TNCV_4427671 [Trichonephila clavipes]|nr:hypothetical protein TNCV_4427671 [Trichonephila clavipes]